MAGAQPRHGIVDARVEVVGYVREDRVLSRGKPEGVLVRFPQVVVPITQVGGQEDFAGQDRLPEERQTQKQEERRRTEDLRFHVSRFTLLESSPVDVFE